MGSPIPINSLGIASGRSEFLWASDETFLILEEIDKTNPKKDESKKCRVRTVGRDGDCLESNFVFSDSPNWKGVLETDLVATFGSRLARIDRLTGNVVYLKDDFPANAVAVSNNRTKIAVVGNGVVILLNSKFEKLGEITLTLSNATGISWADNGSRLIVRSNNAACICDPERYLTLFQFPVDGQPFCIPSCSDTFLLNGRLCSSVTFRERWNEWSKTLSREFSKTQMDVGPRIAKEFLEYSLQALTNEKGAKGFHEAYRRTQVELFQNSELSVAERHHAIRAWYSVDLAPSASGENSEDKFQRLRDHLRGNDVKARGGDLIEDFVSQELVDTYQLLSRRNRGYMLWVVESCVEKPGLNIEEYFQCLQWALEATLQSNRGEYELYVLGLAYYRVDDYAKCIETMEMAMKLGPKYLPAKTYSAMALFKQGETERANTLLDEVVKDWESDSVGSAYDYLEEAFELFGRAPRKWQDHASETGINQ